MNANSNGNANGDKSWEDAERQIRESGGGIGSTVVSVKSATNKRKGVVGEDGGKGDGEWRKTKKLLRTEKEKRDKGKGKERRERMEHKTAR